MKRFVDLRGQGCCGRFAWFDTVSDTFESFGGEYVFDTWDDFVEACRPNSGSPVEFDRYRSLVPDWAFQPKPEGYLWPELPGFANGRLERMDRRLYLDQAIKQPAESPGFSTEVAKLHPSEGIHVEIGDEMVKRWNMYQALLAVAKQAALLKAHGPVAMVEAVKRVIGMAEEAIHE